MPDVPNPPSHRAHPDVGVVPGDDERTDQRDRNGGEHRPVVVSEPRDSQEEQRKDRDDHWPPQAARERARVGASWESSQAALIRFTSAPPPVGARVR
jgi:hypothetical protein